MLTFVGLEEIPDPSGPGLLVSSQIFGSPTSEVSFMFENLVERFQMAPIISSLTCSSVSLVGRFL